MSVWAIGDPHLSFASSKPMDVFGPAWQNHARVLAANWRDLVGPADTVIIPGDISWGINLEEAGPDLAFLEALPGHKLLGRGNHDYWWNSLSKLRELCRKQGWKSLEFLQNNAYRCENYIICYTRGWVLPGDKAFGVEDLKIYQRELIRLSLSLKEGLLLRQADPKLALIMATHYPPLPPDGQSTAFTDQLEASGVSLCLYGHAHGAAGRRSFRGLKQGIQYCNVAGDQLGFRPWRLDEAAADLPLC